MKLYNIGTKSTKVCGNTLKPGGCIEATQEQLEAPVTGILLRHGFLKVGDDQEKETAKQETKKTAKPATVAPAGQAQGEQ